MTKQQANKFMEKESIKEYIAIGYDEGYMKALNDIKKLIEESNTPFDLEIINFFIKATKENLNKTEEVLK